IIITNGTQIYASLTNTTVILSNQCELRVTATTTPISGCIINLTSADTSLVLLGIKPSVLVSTYLSQVRINGAGAVVDSNCRVIQYGNGAIVLPHAPSFQPLQVFSGPHFTGSSNNLSAFVYYKGSGLGAMNATISSFRLKRGYTATFAEGESGNGQSRNYVAADGDLEISVLPSNLDNKVRFVYVAAWRWATKKGIAGNIESGLNLGWKYNWNMDQNSTRDLQYIPIRQTRWWPGLGQNWQTMGADHLLGYNEPDRPDQANMAVGDAIYSWPDLLGTGLRLGAPAVSDGGRDWWLYPFMDQADAAGLRVDYVPIHYYWCFNPSDPNGAANQFYNFLKATYDEVKRPLWITEWNNGANWTGCGDPSFAQQQAAINAMIDMLDSTPFVERYAPYNWVEDVRRLKWDDGSLTSAGTAYRDQVSPIGYVQTLPSNGTRSFSQLRFENDLRDSSGYANNGIGAGRPAYTNGVTGQALVFDGATTVVTLPQNVATGAAFTFAAWINWDGGANWQRIFDFGNSTTHYLFLTPKSGANTLRFGIKNGGTESYIEAPALPANEWHHVAVTLGAGTARIFVDGAIVASATGWSANPATFSPRGNFLGDSQWPADPLFKGLMDEVLITDYAIGAAQMASLLTNTAPEFTPNYLAGGAATELTIYSNNVAAYASDSDSGDALTFSKANGPAWLNVAADGALTGTPTSGDGGTNFFTIRVTDLAGQNAFLLYSVAVTTFTAAGTWITDTSSTWSTANNWSGNMIATGPGQTANFSTINITGNRFVTLNSSRTIGTLRFSDTSGSQTWTLAASGGSQLTLDMVSATSPALIVTNTATISAPLAGTNGFTKSGPGTLILSGNNGLSGTVNIDTSSTTLSDGITRITGAGALANVSLIQIRNNNGGSSTFQLDGSAGSISINAPVGVTCRNNTVGTIQNLSGTNIFNGNILLFEGGNTHTVQSDSGMIVFTGTNQYVGGLTGGRTYYFTGAGHHYLVGPLLNSTNGAPIALLKTNSGSLTMDAVNTYGNGTTLAGGSLIVNGTLPAGTFTISSGTTLGGHGVIYPAVTLPSGATLAPGASIGTLTVSNNLTLQAGSTTRMEISKTPFTN
ncbi:MAG: glycosyl hydrolase, partial [Verrucomicrobiota bacterium]